MQNNHTRPVLMAVLAHPDDESFGMGGTLALYHWFGAETHLVCATRGELGDVDARYLVGYRSREERRVAELRAAAARLGLSSVSLLGYRDSGMAGWADNMHPQALAAAPQEEVTARIVHQIRLRRPQVVVTFDPIGGYRHPDHIAIHHATVRAFHSAADPHFPDDLPPYQPQKLYYNIFSKRWLRSMVRTLQLFGRDPHHFGRNGDIDLVALVAEEFPTHATIDVRAVDERSAAAAMCHASQGGADGARLGVLNQVLQFLGGRDLYMRAYPPAQPGLHEHDLFAGVVW